MTTRHSIIRTAAVALAATALHYCMSFVCFVKHGHAMYSLNGLGTNRGSLNYYWFSKHETVNTIGGAIYSPILRYAYNCRHYSSFATSNEIEQWAEAGGDVFMDDVRQL